MLDTVQAPMRILFVVPYVPSLIRVRPFNLIRRLHARGHHVTVATVWVDAQEQEDLRVLSRSLQRHRGGLAAALAVAGELRTRPGDPRTAPDPLLLVNRS